MIAIRAPLVAVCLWTCAPAATAQTFPLPAVSIGDPSGFLTRAAWFLSVAPMKSGDPRFAWSMRGRLDLDLLGYEKGRITLLVDDELVLGRERREFDFSHENIIFETSASWRVASIDLAAVFHHTSRHVIDRAFDRVVAWHTAGVRAVRPFAVGSSIIAVSLDVAKVVQHTYVDYAWTSQCTIRVDGALHSGAHVFASGSGGVVGVDAAVLHRDPQTGARIEGGMHFPAQRAGVDLFAAYERRVDGFPTSRQASNWVEAGFRLASR